MKKTRLIRDEATPLLRGRLAVETDDSEASGLLEEIERDATEASAQAPEEGAGAKPRVNAKAKTTLEVSPALESIYFRSFGERPLLTREQEVDLAKQVDEGSRAIRVALKEAVRLASGMRKTEAHWLAIRELEEVRQLSGLSAIALLRADEALGALIRSSKGPGRTAVARVKKFTALRRQIKEASVPFEWAKDELVRRNLRLVVDIAKHYNGRGLSLLDLVQEGNIGLMKATERYQYRKGFKFSTYATWWVRQGITRALADQSRTIRVPVHMTEASHRILRTTRRLVQQLGREPRLDELSRALQVRSEKIHETVQAFQEPISLENPIGDGETLLGEFLADRQAIPPDAHVHQSEMKRELDRILAALTPREQLVIRMRFGIGQDEPFTLEQVGEQLSVTRERIRQIEAKALKKLKSPEVRHRFTALK